MTKANECTCPSGDGSLRHPCPAHIGPFDKLVGSPVHNESEPDLPPLDEHLAQVFETGMALSESVEQAGGDERDLQAEGAQGELLPCPFCGGQAHLTYDDYVHDDLRPMPVVECNACHTWVRAESWNKRAALAQPSPAQARSTWPKLEKPAQVGGGRFSAGVSSRLVVEAAQRLYEFESTPEKEAERIERLQAFREKLDPLNLAPHAKAFNEAPAEALKPEQAEAERPEVVAWRYGFS
ncbi:hypothetical protein ACOAP4_26350, partial [Pseudomonas aeruginosa]